MRDHPVTDPGIVIRDILERADVGRSAFYVHFQNKDALLGSTIEQMLDAMPPRTPAPVSGPFAAALFFSFPVFAYIGRCRHAGAPGMGRRERALVHQHLHRGLVRHIAPRVERAVRGHGDRPAGLPKDLLTEHIVGTFILVLNWWVDTNSPLAPKQVDDLFLALVAPSLNVAFPQ